MSSDKKVGFDNKSSINTSKLAVLSLVKIEGQFLGKYMSALKTVEEASRADQKDALVIKRKVKTIKLIDFEGKKVYIGPNREPVLLRTAEDIRRFSLDNRIRIKSCQQRRDVMIERLTEHQLIEVINGSVYAVAETAVLPGELKSMPEVKNYARSRGLPITNKMTGESVKNMLLKIGYIEEEYGKIYIKYGAQRRHLKLRKDIVNFTRSYYLYEGGKNVNIPAIVELLLANNLVERIEGIVFEKEPPVGPMTPEIEEYIALNNSSSIWLSRYYDELRRAETRHFLRKLKLEPSDEDIDKKINLNRRVMEAYREKHQIKPTYSVRNCYNCLIERLGQDANPDVLEKLEIQSIKCDMGSA